MTQLTFSFEGVTGEGVTRTVRSHTPAQAVGTALDVPQNGNEISDPRIALRILQAVLAKEHATREEIKGVLDRISEGFDLDRYVKLRMKIDEARNRLMRMAKPR